MKRLIYPLLDSSLRCFPGSTPILYPVGVLIKPNYDSIADYVIRLALCMLTPPLPVTSVNQLFRDVNTFILLRQMCDQLALRRWQQVHQYFATKVHIVFSILNLQSLSVIIFIKTSLYYNYFIECSYCSLYNIVKVYTLWYLSP